MIRAVFDANVVASGIVGANSSRSTPGELFRRWRRQELTIVTSTHILHEVERTLVKPYFAERLTPMQVRRALELLRLRTEIVDVTADIHGVATHSHDDVVLATAVSAHVRYLVTGDSGLLRVRRYLGVMILSPASFLEHLQPLEN